MKIIIGLVTYKRPKMFQKALESVMQLATPEGCDVEIMVVDNENSQQTQSIFNLAQNGAKLKAHFFVEKQKGIVHARNRVLLESHHLDADLLAFFDDDETVDREWLQNLVQTLEEFNATAVKGKVVFQIPSKNSNLELERFFTDRFSSPTGKKLKYANTSNVLMDLNFVENHHLKFDLRFNESGGSDTHFFDQMRRKGGRIIWCNEALTHEVVPGSRFTEEWVLERAYKSGYSAHIRNQIRWGQVFGAILSLLYFCNFNYRWLALRLKSGSKDEQNLQRQRQRHMSKGIVDALMGKPFEAYKHIHGE